MHSVSKPAILYFGTPVVLISTLNENNTYNLAPISSIFWLGWRCIIGISASSKTTENMIRNGECVLNLPSVNEVDAIDRLALTTGSNPVPETKKSRGYYYEPDKFETANLTPQQSEFVNAPRVLECPVQLEAELITVYPMADEDPSLRGRIVTMELKILRVHVEESILMEGNSNRIDPDKWRPLIMSFQHFYGLSERVHSSRLASIPEGMYAARVRG
ncbi:MAG: flavin reductase family protein [Bacteroidetes bacterium]|nr:flavin reductase family protein [Bacteroidota bacterium]